MGKWWRGIRLWLSRNIGFWVPPVGEWEDAPASPFRSYEMRRLRPDGTYEYRPMTDEELQEHIDRMAW